MMACSTFEDFTSPSFLFDSDSLYTAGSLSPEKVERLTLECYDVQRAGRNMIGGPKIQFKIKGRGDAVYETSYNWALVLNTPENLKAVERRDVLRSQCDEAEAAARAAHRRIKFI